MSAGNPIDAMPRDLWWFRKNVPCLDACPVKTDAGRYVQLIAEGRLAEAYNVARSPNPIASICGRACGAPCEDACRRGKLDTPVTIRALKRFLTAQYGPESLSSWRSPHPSSPLPVRERIEGEGPLTARGVRMSRSAPPITRLARFVAGEVAPKERVRDFPRAIQDSAPSGPPLQKGEGPGERFRDTINASTTPGHIDLLAPQTSTEKKVAVVGAGPAGLACANDLALMGYKVTVFEAMPHAGGMLRYGIPAYRLPREVIDSQVREIEALGVEFRYSTPLKPGFGVRELKDLGYEAIFLAVGASRGRSVPIEGSDADGVIKAIDYLLNINRGYHVPLGGRVVVIGGGLVAIDAARTAVRELLPGLVMSAEEEQGVAAGTMRVALDAAREAARRGALEVTVASLESDTEMPAMKSAQGREELDIARDEGVTFMPGWGPKRILISEGRAIGIELVKCVKVFDDAGRFRPQFDENDKRVVDADTVILAIGQAPDLSFVTPDDGVNVTPAGTLKIDPITLETGIAGVFAGGDAAFPPSLLITCAQHGKIAARGIDAYLRGKPLGLPRMHVTIEELPTDTYKMVDKYEQKHRDIPLVPLSRRTGITEVESTFTAADAREQAERCLYCHIHPIYDGAKCILCNRCVDICPEHCLHFTSAADIADQERVAGVMPEAETSSAFLYDEAKCIRCGLCATRCPTSAITMERFQFEETAG